MFGLFNSADVIMSAKRAFGRGSMMALGAMSGPAGRSIAGNAIKSGWRSNKSAILRNAAIGAGVNVGLGVGSAVMFGGSYGVGDAFRGALFGAAVGAGGTAAHRMGRKNSGNLGRMGSSMQGLTEHSPMPAMHMAMRWGML